MHTVQCWCQVTSILGPALQLSTSHHNLTQQLDFPGARRGAARSYNYKETYYPESWLRDPVQPPAAAWPLTTATFLSWRHLCSALDLVPLPGTCRHTGSAPAVTMAPRCSSLPSLALLAALGLATAAQASTHWSSLSFLEPGQASKRSADTEAGDLDLAGSDTQYDVAAYSDLALSAPAEDLESRVEPFRRRK